MFLALAATAEWTEFRGPSGQGESSATGLPIEWAEGSENIVWKVPVPGQGWSSPVLSGGQIWLTAAIDRKSLHAIAFDEKTGKVLHDVEVFQITSAPSIHEKNTYASPTPILEKDRVYVHFGTLGTAALDRSGKILWKTQQLHYQHGHGGGGSPALADGLLVISCDGTDQQFVVALDKNSGEIRWKTARKGGAMAYTTPLVIPRGDG